MMACLHTERASGFRWEVSAIWLLGLRQNAKTESDTVTGMVLSLPTTGE